MNKGTEIEWDFFKFAPAVLGDNIVMKLGQLWFLPVMLIVVLVNYPLLAWSRRRKRGEALGADDVLLAFGQLLSSGTLAGLEYLLMANKSDYWNYAFPANIVLFFGFAAQFAFQIYLQGLPEEETGYALTLRLIGPLTSIGLNFFKYGTDEKNFYSISMMICYHTVFFAQGVANHTWKEKLS